MKCNKCGTDNNKENIYCNNCGQKLTNEKNDSINNSREINITEEQKDIFSTEEKEIKNTNNEKEAKIIGLISLGLFFLGSFSLNFLATLFPKSLKMFISTLSGMCPMAGIVTMIMGRIKYPENRFLKGVMWSIIVAITLCIIAIILFTIWCYVTCRDYDASGCG